MYLVAIGVATVFLFLWIRSHWYDLVHMPLRRRLMRTGIRGEATVVAVESLGWFPHGGSRYRSGVGMQQVRRRVDFRPDPPGDATITDQIRCELRFVPRTGDRIRVRIDPADPSCAIVVRDALTGAAVSARNAS